MSFCRKAFVVVMLVMNATLPQVAIGQEVNSDSLPPSLWELIVSGQYAAALPAVSELSEKGNHEAKFILANYYICGRVVMFDCTKALALFTSSIKPSQNPHSDEIVRRSKNEVAWINAAYEQSGFKRDTDLALKYAQEASTDKSPYNIDSLAAVLARRGKFDAAVRTQQHAIDGLLADSNTLNGLNNTKNVLDERRTLDEFRIRLKLYKTGKPASFGSWNAGENCNTLP